LHAFDHNLRMLTSSLRTTARPVLLALTTAGVWFAAVGGLTYWALQWQRTSSPVVAAVAVNTQPAPSTWNHAAKALGHSAPVVERTPVDHQFKIWGVIAAASGQGSALISTDGQPPKAYKVGQTLEGGWQLQSLTPKQARLDKGAESMLLELSGTPVN
jgi:general secretion pathway protein C